MNGQQKVAMVAAGTIIVSAINILLLTAVSGGDKIAIRAIRFVFTCVLAFFLWRGAGWARWLVGVLSLLGVIASLVTLFGLSAASISVFSILGIWLLFTSAFYAWVSYVLFLDKEVASFFNPTSGF